MWLTALVLGFAGSIHCMGMCSPLVIAVTSVQGAALLNRIVYNSGRIFAYGCLGATIASVGLLLPLYKFQNAVSIFLGLALIFIGTGRIRNLNLPYLTIAVRKVTSIIKDLFLQHARRKSRTAMFVMGSLNGFLPCGLTLIALTWCVTLRGPADGFNFMLVFGAGTLPVMLGVTTFLPLLVKRLHWSVQKFTTSMVILSGIVLIIRVFVVHLPHASPEGAGLVDFILCR